MASKPSSDDQYSDAETAKRLELGLRLSLNAAASQEGDTESPPRAVRKVKK